MGRSRRTSCCCGCWRSCGRGQRVLASDLRDGTTAGAAAIALIDDGQLPAIGLKLRPISAAAVPGLAQYHEHGRRGPMILRSSAACRSCLRPRHSKPRPSIAARHRPRSKRQSAAILNLKTLDDALGEAYAQVKSHVCRRREQKMLVRSQRRWITMARRLPASQRRALTACMRDETSKRLRLLTGTPESGPGTGNQPMPVFVMQDGNATGL